MPFVNFRDMLEGMDGAHLDAAFQDIMDHIEDHDLRQALAALSRKQRATLRLLIDEVDRLGGADV